MFTFPKNRMSQKAPLAVVLLFCMLLLFLVVTSMIVMAVSGKFSNPAAGLRICAVIQDLLVFILPAIAVAMLSTRYPASLLAVDKLPDLRMTLLAILTLLVSVPAINQLVEWNQNITFPDSLKSVEEVMRTMEKNAEDSVRILLEGESVAGLVVNILIIGVLAGFSEELFFRGALQRLLTSGGVTPHVMIWVTAFIFSAFHLQFFGFLPRLLLGAFFGYLLWWSGSLWLPILIHVLNNSIVVIAQWVKENNGTTPDIDRLGVEMGSATDIAMVIVSVVATSAIIYMIIRRAKQIS